VALCSYRGFESKITYGGGVIGATAFFAFCTFGVYAADLFFRFKMEGLLDRLKGLKSANSNASSSSNPKNQTQTIDV